MVQPKLQGLCVAHTSYWDASEKWSQHHCKWLHLCFTAKMQLNVSCEAQDMNLYFNDFVYLYIGCVLIMFS